VAGRSAKGYYKRRKSHSNFIPELFSDGNGRRPLVLNIFSVEVVRSNPSLNVSIKNVIINMDNHISHYELQPIGGLNF